MQSCAASHAYWLGAGPGWTQRELALSLPSAPLWMEVVVALETQHGTSAQRLRPSLRAARRREPRSACAIGEGWHGRS